MRAQRTRRGLLGTAARAAALALLLLPTAPLHAQEADPAEPSPWETLLHRGRLGLHVQPLTAELRRHLGAPEDRGVLVARVEPGRPAAEAGVQVGDVVTAAGGAPIASSTDLLRAVATVPEGETLDLTVVREKSERTLEVAPEGQALPDAEQLGDWLERGLREGSQELREQLEQLEERLEEFERRLREPPPEGPVRT